MVCLDDNLVCRSLGLENLEKDSDHHMQKGEMQREKTFYCMYKGKGAKRPDAVGKVEPYHEASPSSTHRRVCYYQRLLRDYSFVF